MTLKLTLFSPEKKDFVMEILVDADTSFRQFHEWLLDKCSYQDLGNHRFLLCDSDMRVERQICQADDGTTSVDEDVYLMDDCLLGDYLEEEHQSLAYVFDTADRRIFLMEVSDILFGQPVDEPVLNRIRGSVPLQVEVEETPAPQQKAADLSDDADISELFEDSDLFDEDELAEFTGGEEASESSDAPEF